MKLFLSAIVMLILSTQIYGQGQPGYLATPRIFLPSPTAASLGVYGEIPVNLSAGKPEINIPIYSLNDGDVDLNIALSYNASPIQVSSVAGWVGTNWSLNAGGIITRVVKGRPDEGPLGQFFTFTNSSLTLLPNPFTENLTQGNLNDAQNISYIRIFAENWDTEPDMFYYNFMGQAGKFFFDYQKNVHIIPHNDFKIEVNSAFDQFTITTPNDGIAYIFGTTSAVEKTLNSIDNNPLLDNIYIANTGWYLKQVNYPSGQTLNFTYTSGSITTSKLAEESDFTSTFGLPSQNCSNISSRRVDNLIQISQIKRLSAIESDNAIVYFDLQNTEREDIPGDYALSAIRIFSKQVNAVIQKYDLAYTYYLSPYSNCALRITQTSELFERKRLLLNSVTESIPNSSLQGKVFSFEYDNSDLPPTCSCAIDHYGNYNGAISNVTLLPKVDIMDVSKPFGNREPNSAFTNNLLLKKIHYPTGGYTLFDFESPTTTHTETVPVVSYASATILTTESFTTKSQPFSINGPQTIPVTYTYYTGNNLDAEIAGIIRIKDNNNSIVYERTFMVNTNSSGEDNPFIGTAGNYVLEVKTQYVSGTGLDVLISYRDGTTQQQSVTESLGVSRIKGIENYDITGNLATKKVYQYSGINATYTVFRNDYSRPIKNATYTVVRNQAGDIIDNIMYYCTYQLRTSNVYYNLGTFDGNRIYYANVSELNDANGTNGKVMYEFSTASDIGTNSYPYVPMTSYDNRRGLLLKQTTLDATGKKKQELINTYDFTVKADIPSFKIGIPEYYDLPHGNNRPFNPNILEFKAFHTNVDWVKLTSRKEIVYDEDPAKFLSNTETYFYESPDNTQITKKETESSNGKTRVQYNTYVTDYSSGTIWIQDLKNFNIKNIPIETVSGYKNPNGDIFITSGNISTFIPGVKGFKDFESGLETKAPIPLSQFKFSNQSIGNLPHSAPGGSYNPDSKYAQQLKYKWTLNASKIRLGEYSKTYGEPTSILWDYNLTKPVFKAINAEAGLIAYTSFESNSGGNWQGFDNLKVQSDPDAFTGMKDYLLNGSSLLYTVSPANNFTVSYWSKNGSCSVNSTTPKQGITITKNGQAWTYYEHLVLNTSSITISGNRTIDELRLFPSNSLVSSFTYSPLSGLTSITNSANLTVYYEYDEFGRLKIVRDHLGNILNTTEYKYKEQQ